MTPTVTIIIPVYNAEASIHRCVDSVLSQEYTDFELLLVDDGSTDHSGEICDEYGKQDSRVRVLHKENTGVSDTRNLGLENARGEFIQFLDSDDWITPDATGLMVRAARESGCDMVITDFYRVIGERVSRKGDIDKDGILTLEEFAGFMMENPADFYVIGVLILFGFAAKAGLFPLHIWLPNAYTVAPAPSSALLSCLLTKTGVFGTIIVSCKLFLHDAAWGQIILILGIITMVLGAVLAVFSVNLKRTLACSSMSQIGFIIIAIGMQGLLGEHNALAASGTLLHFLNHSLFKLLLFLGAGVIFMNLRELNLNKIRGYGKDKPLLKLIFLMPILGIGGIPLWNGYISKTLIHESMVEYIEVLKEAGQSIAFMKGAEILFLFSGGLTLAYMTKIFVCIFLEDNPYGAPKPVKNGPYISRR